MTIQVRDIASLATLGVFLTSLFTWADILRAFSS